MLKYFISLDDQNGHSPMRATTKFFAIFFNWQFSSITLVFTDPQSIEQWMGKNHVRQPFLSDCFFSAYFVIGSVFKMTDSLQPIQEVVPCSQYSILLKSKDRVNRAYDFPDWVLILESLVPIKAFKLCRMTTLIKRSKITFSFRFLPSID